MRLCLPTAISFIFACVACGASNNVTPVSPSSGPSSSTPGTFSLNGQVTDGASGSGVAGATVSITQGRNAGKSAATNASGTYSLTGLQPPPSGVQELAVVSGSAPGYATQTQTITLTSTQSDMTLGFKLSRANSNVTFSGLGGLPCAGFIPSSPSCGVTSYTESGFTVSTVSGSWVVRTDYGSPGPFILFPADAGATVTGEVRVTGAGATFSFASVDLYSSTTTIPYRITGLRDSAIVFALSDTVPNTFGDFRTITNPQPTAVIDTLSIVLTNPAQTCCRNPTGLDTIALMK
jgi:hypothetical protein